MTAAIERVSIGLPNMSILDSRGRRDAMLLDGSPYENGSIPWTAKDATASAVVIGLGLVALTGCWYGISGEASFDNQYPWLAGSIGAAAIAGLGMIRWMLPAFRRVRRLQRAVTADLVSLGILEVPVPHASAHGDPFLSSNTRWSASGMTRTHLAGCQLIAGKDGLFEVDDAQARRLNLRECGMCSQ